MKVLEDWWLTAARAAVHLPSRTAVVADLHLGYDLVRRRGGDAVPARRVADELEPLGGALARLEVKRLVVAGDLLEDGRCRRDEVLGEFRRWLEAAGVELVAVVAGNHDRLGGVVEVEDWVVPVVEAGMELGGWQVVHGDGEIPSGPTVQGHEHPWLRWRRGVEGPCYLVGKQRLVLPAYSRDAAGGNVLGVRRWRDYRCVAIAGEEVLDFGLLGEMARRKGG